MQKWMKRIRAALGMGLTWAVAWAVTEKKGLVHEAQKRELLDAG